LIVIVQKRQLGRQAPDRLVRQMPLHFEVIDNAATCRQNLRIQDKYRSGVCLTPATYFSVRGVSLRTG
jgi:hypothetical protein